MHKIKKKNQSTFPDFQFFTEIIHPEIIHPGNKPDQCGYFRV